MSKINSTTVIPLLIASMPDKSRLNVSEEKVRKEQFTISGEKLVSTVKKLVKEGNIRYVTIKNKEGKTLIEIPLTFGVVGVLFLPTPGRDWSHRSTRYRMHHRCGEKGLGVTEQYGPTYYTA